MAPTYDLLRTSTKHDINMYIAYQITDRLSYVLALLL